MSPESEQPEAAPLVDMRVLAGLERVVGAAQVQALVCEGIDMYARYCDGMTQPRGRPAEPVQAGAQAHKLKGSAGTLGLRAIADVAGRVEDALESGGDGVDLILELRLTIEATRQELVARGVAPHALSS